MNYQVVLDLQGNQQWISTHPFNRSTKASLFSNLPTPNPKFFTKPSLTNLISHERWSAETSATLWLLWPLHGGSLLQSRFGQALFLVRPRGSLHQPALLQAHADAALRRMRWFPCNHTLFHRHLCSLSELRLGEAQPGALRFPSPTEAPRRLHRLPFGLRTLIRCGVWRSQQKIAAFFASGKCRWWVPRVWDWRAVGFLCLGCAFCCYAWWFDLFFRFFS